MTEAVIYLPPADLGRWLDTCAKHCAAQGYVLVAVVAGLDDALRMVREVPGRKLVIGALEMLGDIELAMVNVSPAPDPSRKLRPAQRRPQLDGDGELAPAGRPHLRVVA